MKLALGPIQYYWPEEKVRTFYESVATWPVDIVYLGEIVCAKRRALSFETWLALAEVLTMAGKEVVLSTLALLEAESEVGALKRICANDRYAVEANDMAAVQLLSVRVSFVVGPHINTYNSETLALLADCGAHRWVAPVELSGRALADLQGQRPAGMETEVFAFGRLPLAFSARCFTARARNRPKDRCEFCCADYPDGLPLWTQEGEPLFLLNGIQLQSVAVCNLVGVQRQLDAIGVDVLRISPLAYGTEEAVTAFRALLDGDADPVTAEQMLPDPAPAGWCNGYWYGKPGMAWEPATLTGAFPSEISAYTRAR